MAADIKDNTDEKLLDLYINDENGLLLFVEDFLGAFCSSKIPDFHKELYKLIRGNLRLALAAPRSFAKSTITCVFYPLYCSIFKLRKDIVIISASETLAIEWLRKIKDELAHNSGLVALYRSIYGKSPQSDKWAENHIILSNGVNIRAKGAEAQIRGFRPDLFVLDDIETDDGVRSEDRRRHLKEWFNKAVMGTLDPTGQLVIIGTILHYLSLLNHLIENAKEFGWQVRMFQAYKEGIQEPGHELWAEKWTHELLQIRKLEIGSFAFSSEYMNNPVPEDAAAFKEDYINYYEDLPPHSCVMVFDPAYTENETSDYKVCSIIAKDALSNRYLVDYVRTRVHMADYLNQSVNLFKRYKPLRVGIPAGVEKSFYNSVIERFRASGLYPEFCELKNTVTSSGGTLRKKEARIVASLQGLFQAGKYYFKKSHKEAIDELLTFPAGKHDDIIDCLASAEQILDTIYVSDYDYGDYDEDESYATQGTTSTRKWTKYG